ncbi:hypothetical protein [Cupriavidus lacunae]|uniref:hypothetical protein n=1 Tax=Cupriavidus lacunae TaxID=2666307 RepID=UPI000E11495B|nr:hypothetical protein [Cupriavidus lacunae]
MNWNIDGGVVDETSFYRISSDWQISQSGLELVEEARGRDLGTLRWPGKGVEVRQPSLKMGGRMIALPNRTVAAPLAEMFERRSDVLAFYPQPFEHEIQLRDQSGMTLARFTHKPAFLLILADGPVVIDVRNEGYLVGQAARGRVHKDEESPYAWHYPDLERYYRDKGLAYELHSDAEIPYPWVVNQRDLDRYRVSSDPGLTDEGRKQIADLFAVMPIIPMDMLRDRFDIPVDMVKRGIVAGVLHADLLHFSLSGTPAPEIVADLRYLPVVQIRVPERSLVPMAVRDGVYVGMEFDFDGQGFVVVRVDGDWVLAHGGGHYERQFPLEVVQYAVRNTTGRQPSEASLSAGRAMLTTYNSKVIAKAIENWDRVLRDDPIVPAKGVREKGGNMSDSERREHGVAPVIPWRPDMAAAGVGLMEITPMTTGAQQRPRARQYFPEWHEALVRGAIEDAYFHGGRPTFRTMYLLYLSRLFEDRETPPRPMGFTAFRSRIQAHLILHPAHRRGRGRYRRCKSRWCVK